MSQVIHDMYLSSWMFTCTKTILSCFSSLSNLQSGASVERQKKTQDTVNRAEHAGTDCIICSENVATVTFNPCGHKVTCSGRTIQNRKKKPSTLQMVREALFREGEPAWLAGLALSSLASLKLSLCLYEKAGWPAEILVILAGSSAAGQPTFSYKHNDNF